MCTETLFVPFWRRFQQSGKNSHHFFFGCDKYTDNREILFNSLNWLPSNINIDVNLLTKGSDFLIYQENTTTCIFKHAFKYIEDSKIV